MANVFIHFEPIGEVGVEVIDYKSTADGLPPYLIPGSLEEENWRSQNPNEHDLFSDSFQTGSTMAHLAAQSADLESLKRLVEENQDLMFTKDSNGWTPLHEGVRVGSIDVVKYLLENGSDANARTGENDDGGSVLYYAKLFLGEDHGIVRLLQQQYNAQDYEPEL